MEEGKEVGFTMNDQKQSTGFEKSNCNTSAFGTTLATASNNIRE